MDRERNRMRDQLLGTIAFLIIQFLLGMAGDAVGLYVIGRPASA